ncbi:MAG: glutamate-5-semialdehyde dehydrogenase [Myxococcota bacterium]
MARAARDASRQIPRHAPGLRLRALDLAAAALEERAAAILEANALDVADAHAGGLSAAMIDRLRLDGPRVGAMAAAVRDVAALPDPVGRVEGTWRRPSGLEVGRMRIPLGVVLMIYESRPNVTADAAALCLKAGNAVILRGGSEAFRSNTAIGEAIVGACEAAGLPPASVQVVPTTDRGALLELLRRGDEIDLCIPRGGESLIRFVAENARMPVVKHYKGVCHVYVDRAADLAMAVDICENAKAQRPGTCNAVETILVHEAVAAEFLPRLAARLAEAGVEVRADGAARLIVPSFAAATEDDWSAEYLDFIVALRLVPDLSAALAHIDRYGSSHTESIVTRDLGAARRFVGECLSSTVMVNASTRLADGGELGLGAEIGISTSRVHAYGPMGALELTTTKFFVFGEGHLRS